MRAGIASRKNGRGQPVPTPRRNPVHIRRIILPCPARSLRRRLRRDVGAPRGFPCNQHSKPDHGAVPAACLRLSAFKGAAVPARPRTSDLPMSPAPGTCRRGNRSISVSARRVAGSPESVVSARAGLSGRACHAIALAKAEGHAGVRRKGSMSHNEHRYAMLIRWPRASCGAIPARSRTTRRQVSGAGRTPHYQPRPTPLLDLPGHQFPLGSLNPLSYSCTITVEISLIECTQLLCLHLFEEKTWR